MSASVLDHARVEIKLASYGVAPATALSDALLLSRTQDYRRAAASRLYPLEKEDILKRVPSSEFHASRKVDGEFTVLVYRQGEVFTINPGGTVRVGLPFLEEAASLLSKAGIKEAMIAGELHVFKDNKRARVHDVVSLVGKPTTKADLDSIQFAVFDTLSLNGAPPPATFRDTWRELTRIFEKGERARIVDFQWISKPDQAKDLFAQWAEKEGSEGVVLRSDTAGSFKIKPRHNLDVAVVGFSESTGDRMGMLHDVLVAVMRHEGTFHLLGRVGGGFSDEQRKEMLSDLKDMAVDSEYSEVNSDHVAYQMVKPDWIFEVSCLDLVAQNTRGGPVSRMVLDWHASNGHSIYRPLRRFPLASVISPQFVRRRDDKRPHPKDIRIDQLSELVDVPAVEKNSRLVSLPKSEVLKREVYVKELKGEQMVRKLLMWKTNKEQVADDFPAYVAHLTDFSPNRKDPLSRELRISSDREQIEQLFEQMRTENVAKGWNLHAATGAPPATGDSPIKDTAPGKKDRKDSEVAEVSAIADQATVDGKSTHTEVGATESIKPPKKPSSKKGATAQQPPPGSDPAPLPVAAATPPPVEDSSLPSPTKKKAAKKVAQKESPDEPITESPAKPPKKKTTPKKK